MWELAIPAAASAIGSLFGYKGGQEANTQNLKIAREQMNFQKAMSDTAYPRAVQGMMDAGLNPMLAYSQGGASTPVGSMPQVQNAAAAAVSSGAAAAQAMSSIQAVLQSKALTDKTIAETNQIKLESLDRSRLIQYDANKRYAEFESSDVDARRAVRQFAEDVKADTFSADSARRKAESRGAQERALGEAYKQRLLGMEIPAAQATEKFYEDIGKSAPWLRFLLEMVKGVSSAGALRR